MFSQKFIFCLSYFLSQLLFTRALSLQITTTEWNSLFDLYNSTSGISWEWIIPYSISNGYPWNFSNINLNNPCSSLVPWQGIQCSIDSSHVITLSLPYYGLKGKLPSSITNLTYLTTLQLSNNQLEGTLLNNINQLSLLQAIHLDNNLFIGNIPQTITKLNNLVNLTLSNNKLLTFPTFNKPQPQLIRLDVSNNIFNQSIPSSILNLYNLQYLNLSFCHFRKSFHVLFSLTNLQVLDLSHNLLTGSIDASIGNLTALRTLNLSNNHLSSTIPNQIGNLKQLEYLSLLVNSLHGSLPEELSNLINLKHMDLGFNRLTGTIPDLYGSNLLNLELIWLDNNSLSGTIPSSLGNLKKLVQLFLVFNRLTGTIPPSLGNLKELAVLFLDCNRLTGTIPSSLGNLKELVQLFLDFNRLTGTIPSSLGNLTQLQWLFLDNNRLFGLIPTSFSNLTQLISFSCGFNNLIGSIPDIFYNFSSLNSLHLNDNHFTGTIPNSIYSLRNLVIFTLFNNRISGSISSSIHQMQTLQTFVVYNNLLSGTIPLKINTLTNLLCLSLYNNLLTGTLKNVTTNLTLLQSISLQSNYLSGKLDNLFLHMDDLVHIDLGLNVFTGSIQNSIDYLPNLKYLDFSTNLLTGNISSSFTENLPKINYFNLGNNKLTGTLPSIIGNSSLEIFYVNNNMLSGSIPSALLSSTLLKSFVASINCFSGTISEEFCKNLQIEQIVLNGLHSSSFCTKPMASIFDSSSYYLTSGLYGSIPSCLFALPELKILHLSGNKLTGTIPDKFITTNIPIKLYSLNLANNMLKGTIPLSILNNTQSLLDVSFNQISGKLSSIAEDYYSRLMIGISDNNTFQNQSKVEYMTLIANVNHLSGILPHSITTFENINILQGNMFECNFDRSLLPKNDKSYDIYQCGSDYTNMSIYFWFGLSFLFCIWCLYLSLVNQKHFLKYFSSCKNYYTRYRVWILNNENIDPMLPMENIRMFGQGLNSILHLTIKVIVWILLILCPINIILSIWFSSQSERFIWAASSVLLEGIIPSFVLMALYFCLVGIVANHIWINKIHIHISKLFVKSYSVENVYQYWKLILIILLNISFVLFVNILYVITINYGFTSLITNIITIGMSLFKIAWNNLLVGIGRVKVEKYFNLRISPLVLLGLSIFNNIISPYLAEALSSPNCFLYTISDPPLITSQFYDFNCYFLEFYIDSTRTFVSHLFCPYRLEQLNPNLLSETSFIPPFHYSYQCSSSLLSSFSYVFIYRYLYILIIEPLFRLYIKRNGFNALKTGNYSEYFCWKKYLPFDINIILLSDFNEKEEEIFPDQSSQQDNDDEEESKEPKESKETNKMKNLTIEIDSEINTIEPNQLDDAIKLNIQQINCKLKNYDGRYTERIAMRILVDIFILLSFGVLFPILGLIIFISLVLYIGYWKFYLGRLLIALQDKTNHRNGIQLLLHQFIELFDKEIVNFQRIIWIGIWFGVMISVFLWSLTIFDTLNLTLNLQDRVIIMIVNILTPYAMLCFVTIFHRSIDNIGTSVIEMKTILTRVISITSPTIYVAKIVSQENPLNQIRETEDIERNASHSL